MESEKNIEEKEMEITPTETEGEKKEMTLGQLIDFRSLFRIKGKPGIYSHRSKPNKSGMICMYSLSVGKNITVKTSSLERLSDYVFFKMDGSEIGIAEVFNNINTIPNGELVNMPIDQLKEIMVPGFDPDLFKTQHAERVREWFLHIEIQFKDYIKENEDRNNNPG